MLRKTMIKIHFIMCLSRAYRRNSSFHKEIRGHGICSHYSTDKNFQILSKYLNVDENKAQYLQLKYPVMKKLDDTKIKDLIGTLYELGFPRDALIKEPSICSILPVTLKFRFTVLQECGVSNVTTRYLLSFLELMKNKTIRELKENGIIPAILNVENKLASYMTQWPTSITTLVYGDINTYSLYSLRVKIIQRYLELTLDLSTDEFCRGLKTYPTIKHRPLQAINETLNILQNEILVPKNKIKSNLYLVHADPENLKKIIYSFKSIGGINMKEIIRMYPKLAMVNYSTMLETRKVLEEYGISNEAQIRCFQIYTLSPTTIKERLEKAKSIPEFNTFYNHPRFLKMIYYNKIALKRMMKLYSNNKKCLSINILSGSTAHYEVFEKAPGDRLGKGKDLVFCINKLLGNAYNATDIRSVLKRHPFWINIPLVQVKYVFEQLCCNFTPKDIFENCSILLYPWNKIRDMLCLLDHKQNSTLLSLDQIDLTKLSSSQKLSLLLYLLERSHYFTGNGVWSDEKHKNIVDLTRSQQSNKLIQINTRN